MKKNNGFTLAEILITLVVIGVISMMAIPTFMKAQQDKDIVSRLEVARSLLAQSTQMAESQSGNIEAWPLFQMTNKDIFDTYYKPNLRISINCFASGSDCWSETHNFINDSLADGGAKYGITGNSNNSFILQDGMSVTLTKTNEIDDQLGVFSSLPTSIVFMVDVNGHGNPNQMGKDVFAFVLNEYGIIPAGSDNDSGNCQKGSDLSDDYWDCSAKVLNDGKRDYM